MAALRAGTVGVECHGLKQAALGDQRPRPRSLLPGDAGPCYVVVGNKVDLAARDHTERKREEVHAPRCVCGHAHTSTVAKHAEGPEEPEEPEEPAAASASQCNGKPGKAPGNTEGRDGAGATMSLAEAAASVSSLRGVESVVMTSALDKTGMAELEAAILAACLTYERCVDPTVPGL